MYKLGTIEYKFGYLLLIFLVPYVAVYKNLHGVEHLLKYSDGFVKH